jgi:alpha-ketoglutarate-dependent taurine dioxygenase
MANSGVLKTEKATETVGAEVLDVDIDRLLHDEDLPDAIVDALEDNGALLFRGLHIDDETQIAFSRKLGDLETMQFNKIPEIMVINLDPGASHEEYFLGNVNWHIDGATSQSAPPKTTVLSAHKVSPVGGETEFASSYAAYDALSDEEKERFSTLRVHCSTEAIMRKAFADPTEEQLARWQTSTGVDQPLVWTHQSGRRSLIIGAIVDYILGMELEEGRALISDLVDRATTPDRVFEHTWTVGDMVMWDNTGVLHRAMPYDPKSGRAMHRCTVAGTESIA